MHELVQVSVEQNLFLNERKDCVVALQRLVAQTSRVVA